MCKDFVLDKLRIEEKIEAGKELLNSAKTDEEFEHILKKLEELEQELEDDE